MEKSQQKKYNLKKSLARGIQRCVNLVDRTDEGIEAVKNEEMLGTVYNDKEGQAREMLNLAFVIATDGDKSDIPLIDGKYVRTPYHKLTLENIEEYE